MARIKNRTRLIAKLNKLPAAIKAEIRKPMERGADEITAMQRSMVPIDDGDLLDSINWVYGEAPKGALTAGKKTDDSGTINDLKITIFAGNEKAYYARWVEFGTQAANVGGRVADRRSRNPFATRKSYRTHSGTPAQPFFYPALRFMRKRIARQIKSAAVKAIKKVAALKGNT